MNIGGGAAKEGDIYESLWAVVGMLDILSGRAKSIRIEEPGVPGMEFHVCYADGHRVYWQCKEVGGSSTGWTMASLRNTDVLKNINERLLDESTEVVFATDASAKDLYVLEDEAKRFRRFARYQAELLPNGTRQKAFDQLVEIWKVTPIEVFSRLLRISVQTAGKRFLREQIIDRIGHRFDGNRKTILKVLQTLYLESSLMEFNQAGLQDQLLLHGIRPIVPVATSIIKEAIQTRTIAFVEQQQRLYINRQAIPRIESVELIASLSSLTGSHDVLLTGRAGGGKSAALLDVIEFYQTQGAAVLALRLDSLTALELPNLFKEYGTTGTPARTLVNAYPDQVTVIVIDQVDAVSAFSGRVPGMKDELDHLLSDARGARSEGHIVHIVLACREVDLQNDHRLQALQNDQTVKAKFDELSIEQVKAVLSEFSAQPLGLSSKELEILRTPLNLRLYCDIPTNGGRISFGSEHDLFAAYWEHKRTAVHIRAETEDHWLAAISILVNSMNASEALNIPYEELDKLPRTYRNALITEAVVVVENGRARFGHERFLDFCVARLALQGSLDPLSSLLSSNQDLFWRAQVRQVLTSLRESGSATYYTYLNGLIQHEDVRPHIKVLALQVLFSFTQPSADELVFVLPMVESGLSRSSGATEAGSWVDDRAWESFFGSTTWLKAVSKTGALDEWTGARDPQVIMRLCRFLNRQAASNGDEVAALLTRWDAQGKLTEDQLKASVFMADLERSDNFFEVVMRWINDGKLDTLGDHGFDLDVQKKDAAKAVRLYGAVFKRWVHVVDEQGRVLCEKQFNLLQAFSGDQVMESSTGAPVEFVSTMLPLVLELSEKTSFGNGDRLRSDMTWPFRWVPESHPSVTWAFVQGCENALSLICDSEVRDEWMSKLIATRTVTANDILCNLFLAHPEHYASKALQLAVTEPFRLDSGPNGAHMWYGHELFRQCGEHVSDDLFGQVEHLALEYTRTDGDKVDFDHWVLASGLPSHRITTTTAKRLEEWRPIFGKKRLEPKESIITRTYSPVPEELAAKYTDEEWLDAMRLHSRDDVRDWDEPGKGGASELARLLEDFAKEDAERYFGLMQALPAALNPTFRFHLLLGLRTSGLSARNKMDLGFLAFSYNDKDCDRIALSMVRDILGKHPLSQKQFDLLVEFAYREECGKVDEDWGDKASERLLSHGINTIPGSAIVCLAQALLHQREFASKGITVVESLIETGSRPILSCALSIPCQLAEFEPEKAVEMFLSIIHKDLEQVSTSYGDRFFHWALYNYYSQAQHLLAHMLVHSSVELRKDCGRHSALVALYFPESSAHVESAFSSDEHAKQGIASVANANISNPKNKDQCEAWLIRLFNDPSTDVQKKAARCFYTNDEPVGRVALYMPRLVHAFLHSPAFITDPTPMLDALDRHTPVLPSSAIQVCERYLLSSTPSSNPGEAQRDYYLVSDLVLKCYHLFTDRESRMRVLTMLDALAVAGHRDTEQELNKYER